jgi:glyoxylase-like metal-dependent hydrolase (beta-lactamase superfamily II)
MILATGLQYVDLHFLGRPRAIATGVISGAGEHGLVDPGPTSCLERLEEGLHARGVRLQEVTHLLLTHIHLDHAGATGTIVKRHPHVQVLVHERGATHMIDPGKLLESATRLYGKDMDRLWGEFLAVPAANVRVLKGGERVSVAGREFEIAYTPGHASHHVSYFDASSGVAFVGDTAGICIDGCYILPPTPPPDIDVEAWEQSAHLIERWQARTLFLTHFGPSPFPPAPHLQTLIDHLHTTSAIAREILAEEGSDEERALQFAERVRKEMRRQMTDAQLSAYEVAAPFEMLFPGLARYWKKKGSGLI